jgi:hypothetical protein
MNEKLKELKAKAYDAIFMIEYWKKELQSINAQISEIQKGNIETKKEENE